MLTLCLEATLHSFLSNMPQAVSVRKADRFVSPATVVPEATSASWAPASTGRGRPLSCTPRRSENLPRAPGVPLAAFPKPLHPIGVGRRTPGGNAASAIRGGSRVVCRRRRRSWTSSPGGQVPEWSLCPCLRVGSRARVRFGSFSRFPVVQAKVRTHLRRFPKVISRVFSLSQVLTSFLSLSMVAQSVAFDGEGGFFTVSHPPGSCMRVGHWFLGQTSLVTNGRQRYSSFSLGSRC